MIHEHERLLANLSDADTALGGAERIAQQPAVSAQLHGVVLQLRMVLRLMPEIVGNAHREQAMYRAVAQCLGDYRMERDDV